MKKVNIITLFLFLNFVFIESALSYDQVLNPEYDRPFHHVENCIVCHDISKLQNDMPLQPGNNLRGIRNVIATPNSGNREVVFVDNDYTDDNVTDYANGDNVYNGICEVCHTLNNHHRNDGSDNTWHYDGARCTTCHLHDNEFAPPVQQAHRTHMDYREKGPRIGTECTICHTPPVYYPGTTNINPDYQFSNDSNYSITFTDGEPLATTTVCNNCHSPGGNYPGGDPATSLLNPDIGAKANFRTGIYNADGTDLKPGKEKWCVTCHDDVSATSKYNKSTTVVYTPPPPPPSNDISLSKFSWYYFNNYDWSISAGDSWESNNTAVGEDIKTGWKTILTTGDYTFTMTWSTGGPSTCNNNDIKLEVYRWLPWPDNEVLEYSFVFSQPATAPSGFDVATFNLTAGEKYYFNLVTLAQCTGVASPTLVKGPPPPIVDDSANEYALAPQIAGDDKTWGFYATGHGNAGVHCTECHDPTKTNHLDHNQRTYEVDEGKAYPDRVVNPWGDSYRLRINEQQPSAAICGRCHDLRLNWEDALGLGDQSGTKFYQTNFRTNGTGIDTVDINVHYRHLASAGRSEKTDTDWDGVFNSGFDSTKSDGGAACVTCHNVHGSTIGRMWRDGRLISTVNTTDNLWINKWKIDSTVHGKSRWQPEQLLGGDYNVSVFFPNVEATKNARYYIKDSKAYMSVVKMDQNLTGNVWHDLGTYNFKSNGTGFVEVTNKDANGSVVLADAVRFVSASETVIIDNTDSNYTSYSQDGGTITLTGDSNAYGGDYDVISPDSLGRDPNPPVAERTVLNLDSTGANPVCNACHGDRNMVAAPTYSGPKIMNRFEMKRWVPNDGTQDAELYITVKDADNNASSVTIDLSTIYGHVAGTDIHDMTYVDKQNYKYVIPAADMNGLNDVGYKLPVKAIENTTDPRNPGVATYDDPNTGIAEHEVYLFPTDPDTIYMDEYQARTGRPFDFIYTTNVPYGVTGVVPWQIRDYFGPGYIFTSSNHADVNVTWTPKIPKPGKYEVWAMWNLGNNWQTTNSVDYKIYAQDGVFTIPTMDQGVNQGVWNKLVTADGVDNFFFSDKDINYVYQDSPINQTWVADAMKFVRVNSEPLVRLSATQNNKTTRIIDTSKGLATVWAIAKDYDEGDSPDTFTYDWSGTDQAILDRLNDVIFNEQSWYNSKITFNTSDLPAGIYVISVTVTDKNGAGLSVTNKLRLKVPSVYPTLLSGVDTDGDQIDDDVEGFTDFDEDGIPNYLDNDSGDTSIPDSGGLTLTTEQGFEINIGETAFKAGSDDGVITYSEFVSYGSDGVGGLSDGNASIAGGFFDFDILGLESVGQSAKIVIPLQDGFTVPSGAEYKKYDTVNGWRSFTVDAENSVYTAMKSGGVCPPPGDVNYSTPLSDPASVGHQCIQLTIQDGGPNDADNLKNAEIKDPGAVFGDNFNNSINTDEVINNSDITYTKPAKRSNGGLGSLDMYTILLLGLFAFMLQRRRKN